MITKYKGSIDEFLNCESVGFVQVKNNITLIESNIDQYTSNCDQFSYIKIINRDSDGSFTAYFDDSEKNVVINYLIMYNSLGEPVGFTNLTQDIDLSKYNIDSITLSFDFTIVNKSVILNIKINYQSHIIKTNSKQAHQRLFNLSVHRAVSKSDIVQKLSNTKLYTRNLCEIFRDNNLLYKYSGYLSKGMSYFLEEVLEIDKSLYDSILYFEMAEINGIKYFMAYDGSRLHIFNKDYHETYNISIKSQLHIGSNFVIGVRNKKYLIYPTAELINKEFKPIQTNTRQYIDKETKLVIEDLELDNISVAKNPINKHLMIYDLKVSGLSTNDIELSRIIDFFGNPNLDNEVPIFAADGLLFTAKIDSDDIIEHCNWYTYNLPGEFSLGKLNSKFDLTTYFNNDNNIDEVRSNESNKELRNRFNEILIGTSINDISFLTTELMLVLKSLLTYDQFKSKNKNTYDEDYMNTDFPVPTDDPFIYYMNMHDYDEMRGLDRYLLNIDTEFNYNPKIYDFESKLKIYDLVGRTGLRNYDKLIKSQIKGIENLEITKFSLNGNLYGKIEDGDKVKLYRL